MLIFDSVTSDGDLPAKTDVAVIGGGIVGVATALELAERGVDVTVFEKGLIGAEQSGRNWGWCRQMGRDPREVPLILESLRLWRGLNARVGAETGFRQCGIVYLCATDAELAVREKWYAETGRPMGLDTRLLTGEETARLQPGASRSWKGALFAPGDGRAEPFKAAPAIANAVRRSGGKVFTNCAVRGIETAAGRVSAVVTERGAVACGGAVIAGGAWTRRFLHNAGIAFPQLTVINSAMRTEPIEAGLEHSCSGMKFSLRRRLDGGYTISHRHYSVADLVPDSFRLFFDFLPALRLDWAGLKLRLGRRFIDEALLKRRWALDQRSPFEDVRILDPAPVAWVLAEAERSLKETFPAFRTMRVAESWAGAIDALPDAVPVMSAVAKRPGLFIASGFSGHGFGLGPGAGRLMADLVTGAAPCVDPTPFRYSRFFDGSKPRPTTGF